jgi:hypothetical protein
VEAARRRDVLARMGEHLGVDGRAVVGFGSGRGYKFDEFRADCGGAGLLTQLELSTWDLRPFAPEAGFLVSVLGRRPG